MVRKSLKLFDRSLMAEAVGQSFRKLSPATQIRSLPPNRCFSMLGVLASISLFITFS